jgi:hypothetical protein
MASALIASTLLIGGLAVGGFALLPGDGAAAAGFAAGLAGAALAAGRGAGFGAGYFAGAGLAFDFAAVFDAITILFAARRCGGQPEGQRARHAPPERIAAGSVDRAH